LQYLLLTACYDSGAKKSARAAKLDQPSIALLPISGTPQGGLFGRREGFALRQVRLTPHLATTAVKSIQQDVRKRPMARSQLRVYYGPQTEAGAHLAEVTESRDTVSVPLGEIFPLLADAVRSERTWLRDFENEEITISSDLYEVILAYQHYRRPSA